jgi:RNA polymerase sigma-70 factor, ECF subfamily
MESEADDTEILAQIRKGSVHLFARLVDRYQQRLFAAVSSMVRNRQDAEDVAQDVFVTAFRKLDQFEGRSSFFTWLRRIAYHHCIDHHRRIHSRKNDSESLDSDRWGAGREEEPLSQVVAHETIHAVRSAIDRLADDQRAIVIMRDMDGLDYAEIAAILEIPIGTVRSRLHRARLELRQILESLGLDSSVERGKGE